MHFPLSAIAATSLLLLLAPSPLLAQSADAPGSSSISFAWPTASAVVRAYGAPDGTGGPSQGITFAAQANETIRAAADGVALYAGPFRSYGGMLIISHGCDLHTVVAGSLRPLVEIGQKIRLGDDIGRMSPQDTKDGEVYFELRRAGIATDPSLVLPQQVAGASRAVSCKDMETAKSGDMKSVASSAPDSKIENAPGQAETTKASDIKWTGKLPWPVRGEVLRPFGAGGKDGMDIAVPEGTKVKTVAKGIVIYAGDGLKDLGNTVLVRHEDSLVTVYGNLSELKARRGQKVGRGEVIGLSGKTGLANEPQLHFQVRKKSAPVDPAEYLRKP